MPKSFAGGRRAVLHSGFDYDVQRHFKSYGHTKDTMFVTIGMNILNIAGNFLVIFGPLGLPVLGVAGVAMSTSFARIIGLIAMIVIVKNASDSV